MLLSLKRLRTRKIKGEHRHRRRSHHKPRHHNENGEAPKNPDKSETERTDRRMTENQIAAFDETLKRIFKGTDHFLTSLALVNHLQRTPVLAAQDLYTRLKWKARRVVPVFTSEQDTIFQSYSRECSRTDRWDVQADILTQLVQAELFGRIFNLKRGW